ncbi:hypothetical protein MLD38_018992 [Melastoma candidum]|uniref:Uncharacterized protein n=1 Tax=Melastoma candidum TaxID=119954 RepID=A0ACB9QZK7_9MYRT|nr:hypothetical protein MLD38_018992 [Melastoma candidum]
MKNSESEQEFYIESDEDDVENVFGKDDGNDSDSSADNANQQNDKYGSFNTQWPQSYRQSIDLYSSVPSPGLTFLGTPSLSRLNNSFLSSGLIRRHTPRELGLDVVEATLGREGASDASEPEELAQLAPSVAKENLGKER